MKLNDIKMPKELKIGPHVYDVIEVDSELQKLNDSPLYGLCDNDELIIYIHLRDSLSHNIDTLWHEIKHAIWFITSLRDNDDEERIIRTMATAELMVLKDNPDLINYLFGHIIFD